MDIIVPVELVLWELHVQLTSTNVRLHHVQMEQLVSIELISSHAAVSLVLQEFNVKPILMSALPARVSTTELVSTW